MHKTRADLGAIAQLGERLLCKQEVVGSIPSGSTKFFDHLQKPQYAPKTKMRGAGDNAAVMRVFTLLL